MAAMQFVSLTSRLRLELGETASTGSLRLLIVHSDNNMVGCAFTAKYLQYYSRLEASASICRVPIACILDKGSAVVA